LTFLRRVNQSNQEAGGRKASNEKKTPVATTPGEYIWARYLAFT
jgi:hypothetical protein